MADLEYSELHGNESILRAAEYLRMLPEWKAKPAKLRSGFVEYGELIARHLVNLYCTLEGKPLTEKIELAESLDPIRNEREAQVELSAVGDRVRAYDQQLNAWHLELAMLRDLVDHIFAELEGPDWMMSSAHIANDRFSHLVESCPFPGSSLAP